MASVLLPAAVWVAPSSSAPGAAVVTGTQSPALPVVVYDFDTSTEERLTVSFPAPDNYSSGGTLLVFWFANATANAVRWGARVGAVTPADADTVLEHAWATAVEATTNNNTTEANRLNTTSLDLSSNLDGLAAGDWVSLLLYRDTGDAADTHTGDARFLGARFAYTAA